jgi:hypothetical protein
LAINPTSSVDVPLSLFSGLNTELAPTDLPEGASPDNQDVAFLPGSVQSRPALEKKYSSPISGNVTVVYHKSYVAPDGTVYNLILDSAGNFFKENVTSSPGILELVSTVTPGSMAQSITAFGREYIAFSDGKRGNESPRQFDGTNFDRVSQDGPGYSCSVSSAIESPVTISGAGAGTPVSISTITPTDPIVVYG